MKPFQVLYPEAYATFEEAFMDYIRHIKDLEKAPAEEIVRSAKGPRHVLDLASDEKGFPLLPPASVAPKADDLKSKKHLIRSFITIHYSEQI